MIESNGFRTLLPVLIALQAGLSGCGGDERVGERHSPHPALPRLQELALPAPAAGNIVDFDVVDDRLFVLERPAGVQVLDRRDGTWHVGMEVGRPGSGPGELTGATGINVRGDRLVIAHPSRLSFLSLSGELLAERSLLLPCRMMRPRTSWGENGDVYVAGACLKQGFRTDTVSAVLAWSADTATFVVVAEDVAYTRDGSVGTVFSANNMLTPGHGGIHGFGAGTSNCHWQVTDGRGAGLETPGASRVCPAVRTLYSSDPPPELSSRIQRGVPGFRIEWPSTLPVFIDRFVTDEGVLLVRPFTADSVVLQMAEPNGRTVAVAPLNGFIGCRSSGCLWQLTDSAVPRILLLETADLGALARGGAR